MILSLVRTRSSIGFLDSRNRMCVALSRAKMGFYIFGDGELLYNDRNWKKVLNILGDQTNLKVTNSPSLRVGASLPLRCTNHDNLIETEGPEDFVGLQGGCTVKCDILLPCGHKCGLLCHPFSHQSVACHQRCRNSLECGHWCSASCDEQCRCALCGTTTSNIASIGDDGKAPHADRAASAASWHAFAEDEPVRYAAAAASPAPSHPQRRLSQKNKQFIESMMQTTTKVVTAAPLSAKLIDDRAPAGPTSTIRKDKLLEKGKEEAGVPAVEDWSKKPSLLD